MFRATEDAKQRRNQEQANRAIPPCRKFCIHDGIHLLQTKSYFSRLRYFYVNFSIPFFEK